METRESVRQLMDELATLSWFTAVGQELAVPPPAGLTVSRVESWAQAQKVIESKATEDFLIFAQNLLYGERRAATQGTKPQRMLTTEFNGWIDATRDPLRRIAERACAALTIPGEVGSSYREVLLWMIQKACVIRQYDEFIQHNRLYCYVLELLRAGHCVCGWAGDFPQGSLVVY